ncbi:unnamed protein product [Paramecium sonneborni]|uniref:MORN repeat-containing protein 3 n=1 Tax=Paramecium sonneborni TaxID=65129 RepID=A0A8S1Q892_9CILI|nr:unnamed protein product [Paramecium sonneborni]
MYQDASYYSQSQQKQSVKNNSMKVARQWQINDQKAEKNGLHKAIYWVKSQSKNEDGTQKQERWIADQKYVGDWNQNKKCGFGVQYYGNGDKYEGGWFDNQRNGQGTYWVSEGKNKMRREYTGDWVNDKKTGKGTMFYQNGNRYDGLWQDDKPHGEGRMIYANGDVYEGAWFKGLRSGYGVLTKRNGDHFEGYWVNDKREGQGSYFFATKNQVFVGEWVDDMPKTGVYSEVEDPYTVKEEREKHFMDPYVLPDVPKVELQDPTNVLKESMELARKERIIYRAIHIPLDEMYSKQEMEDLALQFESASNQEHKITLINSKAIFQSMGFEIEEKLLQTYLKHLQQDKYNEFEIELETFMRLVAIILESQGYDQSDINI